MSETDPWTPEAFRVARGAAFRLGTPVKALVGMLLSESDGYPNPALMHKREKPNAVGLNQILLKLLPSVGWQKSWQDYESLSVVDQLLFVERWIRGRPGPKTNASRLYLSNFLPAYWTHGDDPDFVLCSTTQHPEWYYPNWPAFDPYLSRPAPHFGLNEKPRGEKGYISIGALGKRIDRKLAEPRGLAFCRVLDAVDQEPSV